MVRLDLEAYIHICPRSSSLSAILSDSEGHDLWHLFEANSRKPLVSRFCRDELHHVCDGELQPQVRAEEASRDEPATLIRLQQIESVYEAIDLRSTVQNSGMLHTSSTSPKYTDDSSRIVACL